MPNSALTTLVSGTGFVQTVKNGKVTRTLVRTGAVGATTTQVLSGLTAGQQVVIADLSEPLPTTTTTNRFGARTGTGGLTTSLGGAGGLRRAARGFAGGGGFAGGWRLPQRRLSGRPAPRVRWPRSSLRGERQASGDDAGQDLDDAGPQVGRGRRVAGQMPPERLLEEPVEDRVHHR